MYHKEAKYKYILLEPNKHSCSFVLNSNLIVTEDWGFIGYFRINDSATNELDTYD
jgi:hypothetical protein